MADIKISELEPTTDLEGLYTIGSDKNNLSKKVSLQFLKDAANYANEQGDYAKQAGDTVNGNVGVSDYPEFSASQSYVIGDIVRYNGVLYSFTANHAASAWNGSDVKATSINAITSGKLTELESEKNTQIFKSAGLVGDLLVYPAWNRITNVSIKQGETFKFILKTTSENKWSRIILAYNENVEKRIIDTSSFNPEVIIEYTATEDIFLLDLFMSGANEVEISWRLLGKISLEQEAEINKINAVLNTRGFLSVTMYPDYAMLNVDIKKNQPFKLKISSELKQWSRLLICANLENSNRLLDTQSHPAFFVDGEWMDFIAPYDITWLGLFVVTSVAEKFTMTCELSSASVKDFENRIRESSFIKKINTSANILNPYRAEIGFIDNQGNINPFNGFYTSEYIPIKKGQSLYVSQLRKFALYDISKTFVSLVVDNDVEAYIYTADADGWVRISFRTDAYKMVAYSSEYLPYEPYSAKMEDGVSLSETQKSEIGDMIAYQTEGGVTLTKDGGQLLFSSQGNKLKCAIDNDYANGLFNFNETVYANDVIGQGDDIAPIHAIGTTIGANHAQPCYRASVVNHGKTDDNIGEIWTNVNGEKFYLVGIADENRLRFIGENLSEVLTEGELINGSESLTITSVTSTQMYKAVKNVSHKILNNGVQEITSNGTYTSKYFDVVEYYDIMLTSSTLEKLKNGSHILDGDAFVRIINTYRIMENCNTLIFATLIPLMPFQFSDAMFAQAIRQGENGDVAYYLPNSKPYVYNFTKPLKMYWGNDVNGYGTYINKSSWKDENNPVNRVIQIANNHGFAIGYIPIGVGKELNKYTNNSFELRNNTGKVYPHGVESYKVGGTLQVGQIYSAGMYRCYFPLENLGKKIALYHYDLNGVEYVYADFSESGIETINIGSVFNGRNVEVVESSNVTLISDLYNNGVMVNVDYIDEDTSYIVFKL